MIYKQYKDLKLSALGFGAMRLPWMNDNSGRVDQEAVEKMIDYAMANGVNYYDTAYPYMNSLSEGSIGKALSRYPRDSWYLATKYPGHQNAKGADVLDPKAVFEDQLQKCGVEYFDFYLLHNVNENSLSFYCGEDSSYMDYFVEQKKLGRIKHLGFSCHCEVPGIKQFMEKFGEHMEFCQIQLNYLDWTLQKAKEKVEYLNSINMPIWVMEPVRGGKLSKLDDAVEAKMRELRGEESTSAWAFRWLQTVPQPTMILSGMTTFEHVVDNVKTFSDEKLLNEEELALLKIAADKLATLVPCTACRYCCKGCPAELDIPSLITLYNDLLMGYNVNIPMRYGGFDEDKRADNCIGCGQCTAACPQNIDVPSILADFAERMSKLEDWASICRTRNAIAAEMLAKK